FLVFLLVPDRHGIGRSAPRNAVIFHYCLGDLFHFLPRQNEDGGALIEKLEGQVLLAVVTEDLNQMVKILDGDAVHFFYDKADRINITARRLVAQQRRSYHHQLFARETGLVVVAAAQDCIAAVWVIRRWGNGRGEHEGAVYKKRWILSINLLEQE